MNSKQRRLTRRYYRHEVVLNKYPTYHQYLEMFDWCKENFGDKHRDGWRGKPGDVSNKIWQFDCLRKAAWFRLRWS